MALNKGKPTGINKSETPGSKDNKHNDNSETGKPVSSYDHLDDDEIPGDAREINPNRNVDKTDATNAGGYRN